MTIVSEQRKQAVSIRLGTSDVRKIKRVAERLGVRDSDVIRFALKSLLNRIAPLCDPEIRGRTTVAPAMQLGLVPVFVEAGCDLIAHFDLDAFRLEAIINEGADDERLVDHDDVVLLAMSGTQQPYLKLRLNAFNGPDQSVEATGDSLRHYLYAKYVYRQEGAAGESLLAQVPVMPKVAAG